MPPTALLPECLRLGRVPLALVVGLGLVAGVPSAKAQVFLPGEVAQLSTTEGFFVTREITLVPGVAAGVPSQIRFSMGFGTQETPSAGGLHDSLSATLAAADNSLFAAVATMDVFGLAVAPVLAGGVSLDPGSVHFAAATLPLIVPSGYPTAQGYDFSVSVPDAFAGKELKLYFDLVTGDADGTTSEGRVQVPLAAVPEPQAWWLLGGLPAWAWLRRGRSGPSRPVPQA